MKRTLPHFTLLTLTLTGLSSAPPSLAQTETEPPADSAPEAPVDARFACQVNNGEYTVMYLPESQPNQAYPWAVPQDLGSAWPAQRRCEEISRRLESYRPDGLLELQTGVENGYNIVCVTTQAVPTCRIVFTVPPGQDPLATRDGVFENLVLADRGETTQGVTTFAEGDSPLSLPGELGESMSAATGAINLRPFLDPADGGTGTRLNGRAFPNGRPLDPENFR